MDGVVRSQMAVNVIVVKRWWLFGWLVMSADDGDAPPVARSVGYGMLVFPNLTVLCDCFAGLNEPAIRPS